MVISRDVAWTSEDQRVVAMDLATPGATPYVLEASAAVIWEEIAAGDPITTDELLQRLAETFEVDAADIRGDVEAMLQDLRARRLLTD